MSGSKVRSPVVAGRFYEGRRATLKRAVADCVGEYAPPEEIGELLGGVVPHAGWVFSGPTAAQVFATLSEKTAPATYVLCGAVHQWGVKAASVYPAGAWATPLGEVAVDEPLAAAIIEAAGGIIVASASAHDGEHSIEVQVPFIQALSPEARIVPIAIPPNADSVRVGQAIASALSKREQKCVVVASTDLTHYGMGYGVPDHGPLSEAMPWMRENDNRFIHLVESLRAEEIVPEAAARHNACGAGAVAAAVAAARELGAVRGRTLQYTTSADAMPEPLADRAVGYVGMVFEK